MDKSYCAITLTAKQVKAIKDMYIIASLFWTKHCYTQWKKHATKVYVPNRFARFRGFKEILVEPKIPDELKSYFYISQWCETAYIEKSGFAELSHLYDLIKVSKELLIDAKTARILARFIR